jgi:dihydrolipoamide dehydrogenase
MADPFDLIVIGSGPAGYVGAIRAAQLGLRTACVEADRPGGVCLNIGCIPTKALLHQAEAVRLAHQLPGKENVEPDFAAVMRRPDAVVDRLSKGVTLLFRKHGVELINGRALIRAAGRSTDRNPHPCVIDVVDQQGSPVQSLQSRHVVVATGARPVELPFAPFDGKRIIGSRDALQLTEQPRHLAIIGAGAIGVEFASFFHAMGTQVTLIEMADRLLPLEDHQVSAALAKAFRRARIKALTGHRVTRAEPTDQGVHLVVQGEGRGAPVEVDADCALVAIGVRGETKGLFDPSLSIELQDGHIRTDYRDRPEPSYATSLPGIHAVGDVIGPPWLAHVASAEATACVERLAGLRPPRIHYDTIPACTYSHPQVASIGPTTQALEEAGMIEGEHFLTGTCELLSHGMAVALGENFGLVKLVAEQPGGRILAGHMIGHQVTELIGEIALGIRTRATLRDLAATIHPHPTMSEAIHEAALDALGEAAHS